MSANVRTMNWRSRCLISSALVAHALSACDVGIPPYRVEAVDGDGPSVIVSRMIASPLPDGELRREVLELAMRFSRGSRYGNRVRVNEPYQADALNIVLVQREAGTLLPAGCVTAAMGLIMCDASWLANYLDNLRIPIVRSERAAVARAAFRAWVIGHEIGHSTLGHTGGFLGQASRPATQPAAWTMHAQEHAADLFAAREVGSMREVLQEVLVEAFNAEPNRVASAEDQCHPLCFVRAPDFIYPYRLWASHPAMPERIATMLASGLFDGRASADALGYLRHSGVPNLSVRLEVGEQHVRR